MSAKNDPLDSRQHDGSGALGTGLKRDVERGPVQPVRACRFHRAPQHDYFCVPGEIPLADGFIVRRGDDAPAEGDRRADRYLAGGAALPRGVQRGRHARLVGVGEGPAPRFARHGVKSSVFDYIGSICRFAGPFPFPLECT
jgi:hypothetical protein